MNEILIPSVPAWVVMWLITAGIFFLSKIMILIKAPHKPRGWRLIAFFFLWVGMDEKEWLKSTSEPKVSSHTFLKALLKMVFGGVLLWLVARQFSHTILTGWCGMIGLVFLLHFGLFDIVAIIWNKIGVPVKPIMENPAGATSLTDFWGRRWNIAFRDLAHIFIFKPFVLLVGTKKALCISFIFSGILHELLISVPAGAGFGLPTIYFFIQAVGILIERQLFKNIKSTEKLVARWFLTHAFTVLPVYFLFHPPFVERVMIPFFQSMGALP